MTVAWRLFVSEPLDGAANMAVDEALLLARVAGQGPPTVRFFSWEPPTVSLGYGQPVDARINLEACRRLGVGLVRRPTGGSAVYHDTRLREVTYSVVASAGDFPGADDLLGTYQVIGRGLAGGLRQVGVPAELVPIVKAPPRDGPPTFCFARTGSYELVVGGKKAVGSAQRRQAGAFLQHGSILLDADAERLRLLFPGQDPLAGMTTLAAVLGRAVGFDDLVPALAAGMAEALGVELVPGGLTPDEQAEVQRLVKEKYGTEAWTLHAQTVADLGALRPASLRAEC